MSKQVTHVSRIIRKRDIYMRSFLFIYMPFRWVVLYKHIFYFSLGRFLFLFPFLIYAHFRQEVRGERD